MDIKYWVAFLQHLGSAIKKATTDFKANKPLAPSTPMTSAELSEKLKAAQAAIAKADAWVQAHPGAVTALDDLLGFLKSEGVNMASSGEASALAHLLTTTDSWMPTLISFQWTFSPAPTWQPGPGRIGR